MLFIVIGLPGTGKSTVSRFLAEKYDAIILNTDEFRKKLFNIDETKKDQLFPKEWQNIPYRAMFLAAEKLIECNKNTVIDAALYSQKLVSDARSIASKSKVVKVVCPEDVTKARLKERVLKSGSSYSAGLKVYEFMKSITEEIPDADIVVDTSREIESQLEKI